MHVEIVIAKTTEKVKNQKAQGFPSFQKIREILFFVSKMHQMAVKIEFLLIRRNRSTSKMHSHPISYQHRNRLTSSCAWWKEQVKKNHNHRHFRKINIFWFFCFFEVHCNQTPNLGKQLVWFSRSKTQGNHLFSYQIYKESMLIKFKLSGNRCFLIFFI